MNSAVRHVLVDSYGTRRTSAGRLFAYDVHNRLTSVGDSTFTYDAEGRRIARTATGITTTFVHDPNAALSRLLQSRTGSTTTRYVYAGSLLLYAEAGSALRVHHYDFRGSTVALTDDTGAVLGRVTYGSYGEIVARTGDTATEFLYNGRDGVVTDPNGLYHMRARYYSPETRRFLNADPIGFGGGINWYAYVGSSPVMNVDPRGLTTRVTYSDGKSVDVETKAEFEAAMSAGGNGNLVARIEFGTFFDREHGSQYTQVMGSPSFLPPSGVVYDPARNTLVLSDNIRAAPVGGGPLSAMLDGHLASNAEIVYRGCATASGEFNIARATSEQIAAIYPEVSVIGMKYKYELRDYFDWREWYKLERRKYKGGNECK